MPKPKSFVRFTSQWLSSLHASYGLSTQQDFSLTLHGVGQRSWPVSGLEGSRSRIGKEKRSWINWHIGQWVWGAELLLGTRPEQQWRLNRESSKHKSGDWEDWEVRNLAKEPEQEQLLYRWLVTDLPLIFSYYEAILHNMMMEIGAEIAEKYLFKYSREIEGWCVWNLLTLAILSCPCGVLPAQVHLCTVSLYIDLLLFGLKYFVPAMLINSSTQQQIWAGAKACSTG